MTTRGRPAISFALEHDESLFVAALAAQTGYESFRKECRLDTDTHQISDDDDDGDDARWDATGCRVRFVCMRVNMQMEERTSLLIVGWMLSKIESYRVTVSCTFAKIRREGSVVPEVGIYRSVNYTRRSKILETLGIPWGIHNVFMHLAEMNVSGCWIPSYFFSV